MIAATTVAFFPPRTDYTFLRFATTLAAEPAGNPITTIVLDMCVTAASDAYSPTYCATTPTPKRSKVVHSGMQRCK